MTTLLTQPPFSELLPKIIPHDTAYFSAVRVEDAKNQVYRLWKFPMSGSGAPIPILPNLKRIGYYCWLYPDWLALFIAQPPYGLVLAQVSTGDTIRLDENIGSTLLRIPGQDALSYLHTSTPKQGEIKQLNLKTRQLSVIAPALEGTRGFGWLPDGSLLTARQATLYRYVPGAAAHWIPVADLSRYGIRKIHQVNVAAQGNRLALVAE